MSFFIFQKFLTGTKVFWKSYSNTKQFNFQYKMQPVQILILFIL